VVIAGHSDAVDQAMNAAHQAGAKKVIKLAVSVPSHCALMRPAAEQLSSMLETTTIHLPKIPVLHNVDVAVSESTDAIREKLVQQLYQPVRWVETIQMMKNAGMGLLFESGPGKVLSGLGKRIDKTLSFQPIIDPASLEKALESCDV